MLSTIPKIENLRRFFQTEATKPLELRRQNLEKLKNLVSDNQEEILKALKADLNKPELEGYLEIAAVNQEINHTLKHLKTWAKPQKVKNSLSQFPSSAWVYPEPLGVVLIIGPWNYPFSLLITPLIGAIAGGNCSVLKPSEFAPHTSRLVANLLNENFPPEYIQVIEGGVETSQELLREKYDHIFFTGGTSIGKIIMAEAAKHLTPVTLELGGKSPCIVDRDINVSEAAARITWGKFLNAGQTCIAPDYLLVHNSRQEEFIESLMGYIERFYGDDPQNSPDYARIIHEKQFDRLCGYLAHGRIIIGGQSDRESRYIAPTVITDLSFDSPIMEEEIFGPILPVFGYDDLSEAIDYINSRPKPLALYLFSNDKFKQDQVLGRTSSGGVCINDTIMHVGVNSLPFGGVGESGIGRYHGKYTFDTFVHYKSVLKKTFLGDGNWRYPPYGNRLSRLKPLFKFF
ncbi:MAG: 4,4'-diaponeurosporen-aldehyde dehydrogenase [Chroococcopsis gigantea SAG 12.99]|jgi:aldehyde dehydrogenase (NAD+)|nr:aldehyde dehydrogenase [Chlorogloea purpurea SAG 13.99]MDV3000471.1 4,4'-diaponeurosporen-aldehyde dehydrogenase [Chroococcopsis gigantea SAG 12.99]